MSPRVLSIADLDFAFRPAPWRFAEEEAPRISAHWAARRAEKPALFNGRILLLGAHRLFSEGGGRIEGAYFETDFAAFLAWRDHGFPGDPVANCFSMAALRGSDGGFVLGEMGGHTANAGRIYFPAGTPDPKDVFDGRVDLDASARRELLEETGVDAREASVEAGWTVVYAPPRIACMKVMTLAEPATAAKARIDAFLAGEREPELTRMHVVARHADIDEARMPPFVAAFLRSALAD